MSATTLQRSRRIIVPEEEAAARERAKKLAARDAIRQDLARKRLINFTTWTMPDYRVNWHHDLIARELDAFIDGDTTRLMLFMPPRMGKTELSSRRLPALAFGKNPDLNIIACSYSADLAERVSRDVQRIMDTEKYRALFPETQLGEYGGRTIRRNDIFEIAGKRGVYRAAGVRGGIGGMGADIAIIDDPIKDRLQAESEVYRDAVWEWFTSTLFMRLERRGRLLLTLTRWHHDDIAGRLLRMADEGLLGSTPWKVICLRGIREDEPLDYDPRQPGEALWPWKKSAKSIYDIKSLNSYDYEALFQQRPTAAEGALFKREWFKTYTCTSEVLNGERVTFYNVPQPDGTVKKWLRSKLTRFVTIDLAMSLKTSADYTVLAHWGLTPDARLLLLELERVRLEGPDHEAMVKRHWLSQKPSLIGIESVQYQSTLAKSLARQGLPCIELKPDRDKYARAIPAAAMAEALGVWVPEAAPWLAAFVQEHLEFPRGTHDDMVDCLSYAAWIVSNRLSSAASLPIGVGKTSYWR